MNKTQLRKITSASERIRTNVKGAAQIVTTPAGHGNKQSARLVTPARNRTQVPVPAKCTNN